jgi:hypothetical protein
MLLFSALEQHHIHLSLRSFCLDTKRTKKIKAVEKILEIHIICGLTNPNSSLLQKCANGF